MDRCKNFVTVRTKMSYIVHVTAVVEGDLEQIEALINEYRYNCLQNQPGMESFYVCRPLDQPNVFLYTQVFKETVHVEFLLFVFQIVFVITLGNVLDKRAVFGQKEAAYVQGFSVIHLAVFL